MWFKRRSTLRASIALGGLSHTKSKLGVNQPYLLNSIVASVLRHSNGSLMTCLKKHLFSFTCSVFSTPLL